MIQLVPMKAADFQEFMSYIIPVYAEDNIKSGRWEKAGATEKSAQAFRTLLPQGEATPHNLLFNVVKNGTRERVGFLWMKVEEDEKSAFLYQIDIVAAYRGQGFGSSAIREAEEILKKRGIRKFGLHVFGFNDGAIRLYKKLGFQMTSFNMQKTL